MESEEVIAGGAPEPAAEIDLQRSVTVALAVMRSAKRQGLSEWGRVEWAVLTGAVDALGLAREEVEKRFPGVGDRVAAFLGLLLTQFKAARRGYR